MGGYDQKYRGDIVASNCRDTFILIFIQDLVLFQILYFSTNYCKYSGSSCFVRFSTGQLMKTGKHFLNTTGVVSGPKLFIIRG